MKYFCYCSSPTAFYPILGFASIFVFVLWSWSSNPSECSVTELPPSPIRSFCEAAFPVVLHCQLRSSLSLDCCLCATGRSTKASLTLLLQRGISTLLCPFLELRFPQRLPGDYSLLLHSFMVQRVLSKEKEKKKKRKRKFKRWTPKTSHCFQTFRHMGIKTLPAS